MAKKTTDPLPSDLFWESTTADRLGISRSALRLLRRKHLSDADWRFHNNAVALTAGGLAKIESVLSAAGTALPGSRLPANAKGAPAAPLPGVPSGPPPRRHFVVVKVPIHRADQPQKKLLTGRPVPAGFVQCQPWELVKKVAALVDSPEMRERAIRVRDNTNFRPGMVFEAVSIGDGMWAYVGRLPRRPGRW